ncbi:beta-1,3-galactosyl-O-glycosyl-glycoprotein beta-1,6-N-acetylglucosaminyltransferase 4-like [Anarrhichthys ocellatus]|uniref:beta-1,3-galactosyl-O-glycosyl-glycoprotein beta-1,6-N-acetylglucosaminyltransferase 4-like n=1 Tax=Anarrhichthys ocellatus TaxID=433405 RepID=UPI0012EED171|nr:beta-1,3-galactosyl-O-glycosyl-glycoprotein beta-1,6-N-acetylglucosaminyltransferase 4-like [Anarrhichthys ocellatus]
MKTRCALYSFLLLTLWTLCVLLLVRVKHSDFTEYLLHRASSENIQIFHKYNINCLAIYDLDPVEVGKSLVIRRKQVVEDKEENLVKLMSDCSLFIKSRGYDDVCVSEEEKDFPLAYSLVVHKSALMVERLIKALYSPRNIYCIHYDQKSPALFISAMEGLARCLPNVFIASKREFVFYGSVSRLKADLNCLSDLLVSGVKWKYVINLCGQDFPLRSNIELVSELRKLNGTNMLETCRPSKFKKQRFTFHHELSNANIEYEKVPMKTEQMKTPPPHGIEVFSGNAYFVLTRDFVVHMDTVVVKDFLAWSEDTFSPDEHFWATLVRLPGVPGEVPRSQPDITDLMSKTRLVKWQYLEESLYPPCSGKHVRSVCIYGAAEMRWLLNYGHWFANKFDLMVDPIVIQCLEEKLEEKQKLFQSMASHTCHED